MALSDGSEPRRAAGDATANARGFIVVAVLWILAALSALVLVYLSYVTTTAVVVTGSSDRVQAEALQTAAIELAVYRLIGVRQDLRPSSGTFSASVGRGKISVTFRSEAGRIDLNAAPKALLAGLMTGLGVTPSNAETYADRIVAWRTPTEQGEDDPENSFYRTSGTAYLPRHAPFPHPEELWLVQGIPAPVIERMLPFVTVFSNLASVDVLAADPQVVAVLPGMTPERLQSVLAARDDPNIDPRSLSGAAGGPAALQTVSRAYRMAVRVESGNGRANTAEAVVLLLDSGNDPYRILSWRNASDTGAAAQRAFPG